MKTTIFSFPPQEERSSHQRKDYDIFRQQGGLLSCSNYLDYLSCRLLIRYGASTSKDKEERKYVHMLNVTLCVLQRTLRNLLKTHQTSERTAVPEVM
ncbi:MAG: hypothetical protein EZS28_035749 [Streblomastix strix]|uniref:Uncharacterized protein n=1 Tax=Streblomastix strix TaxID=222440 RepID=A0A5J4UET1_9EUKA|nr:MAG: hypothetical protein EZS28_035749 [Streblomastix strix]